MACSSAFTTVPSSLPSFTIWFRMAKARSFDMGFLYGRSVQVSASKISTTVKMRVSMESASPHNHDFEKMAEFYQNLQTSNRSDPRSVCA